MFKLDNGSELFSSQDMQRLRKAASEVMGSRPWVEGSDGEAAHLLRSEERRVGKECRSRWSPYH